LKFIRFKELKTMLPLGRTTIWRMMQEGRFPQSVKIGTMAAAWLESDIMAWMQERQIGKA
jgi:prophage regulatory protein